MESKLSASVHPVLSMLVQHGYADGLRVVFQALIGPGLRYTALHGVTRKAPKQGITDAIYEPPGVLFIAYVGRFSGGGLSRNLRHVDRYHID